MSEVAIDVSSVDITEGSVNGASCGAGAAIMPVKDAENVLGNTTVDVTSGNGRPEAIVARLSVKAPHTETMGLVGQPSSPPWRQDINAYHRHAKTDFERPANMKKSTYKQVRAFYDDQNELIDAYVHAESQIRERLGETHDEKTKAAAEKQAAAAAVDNTRAAKWAVNLSFAGNVLLFGIKIFAAAYSGSLAVIGSAIDSSLDLLSGSIIFAATKIAARRNPYRYPVGKTRLEPLAIIVFASVMGVAALQLIVESIQVVAKGVSEGPPAIKIDGVTYGVLGAVIALKTFLLIFCKSIGRSSPSVDALAQDHFNDVITNTSTIVAVALASKFEAVWWLDPATAMALAVLIVFTWSRTGREHIVALTGKVADKLQLSVLTYLAMNHDERIMHVDTVRAYSVGQKLLVELDIIMPPEMPLREAHDVGESLQRELEAQEFVERAFVHLDTEFQHTANDEHLPVW